MTIRMRIALLLAMGCLGAVPAAAAAPLAASGPAPELLAALGWVDDALSTRFFGPHADRHAGDDPLSEAEAHQNPSPSGARVTDLEHLARRLSVSVSLRWREHPWLLRLRVRYSRSVAYDIDAELYTLVEVFELSPIASYAGTPENDTDQLGAHLDLRRPLRIITRQTRFPSWRAALFAKPYRLKELPLDLERALAMEPGTSVAWSLGTAVFLGPKDTEWFGEARGNASGGIVLAADYFTSVERLLAPGEGGREWVLAVGGTVRRSWELRLQYRTPKVVHRFRVMDLKWQPGYRGLRFLYGSGPVNLAAGEGMAELYGALSTGVLRLPDLKLMGKTFRLLYRRDLGLDFLDRIESMSELRRVLEAGGRPGVGLDWPRTLTSFRGAQVDFRFWLILWENDWIRDRRREESVVDARRGEPEQFFAYLRRRERVGGWLFVPREIVSLDLVSVQDFLTGETYTEAILEIRDRSTSTREAARYRSQVRSLFGERLLDRFQVEPASRSDPDSGVERIEGVPDLESAPRRRESVSIVARLILGPSFHAAPSGPESVWDPADLAARAAPSEALQRRILEAVYRGGTGIDPLVAERGFEDAHASFRIAVEPARRQDRRTEPLRVYRASTGDPAEEVPVYRRLRRLFDAAGGPF